MINFTSVYSLGHRGKAAQSADPLRAREGGLHSRHAGFYGNFKLRIGNVSRSDKEEQ
jgi:hypothetical protein